MVGLEVCRGRSNSLILNRFRKRFAIIPFIAAGTSVWDQATQLVWSLDRRGVVLPAPDLPIAACALSGWHLGLEDQRCATVWAVRAAVIITGRALC